MEIGLVGLGKMGGNMRERLRRPGHTVVGYDRNPDISDVASLEDLVEALPAPRVVWVMVPGRRADPGDRRTSSAGCSSDGDVVVDGGNSRYTDDQVHADDLREHGHRLRRRRRLRRGLGAGERLRAHGRRRAEDVAKVQPVFDALKPEGEAGFVHAGPVGAGHFAKMVHNGIEYGLMQAYAEGYELLEAADVVEDVPGVIKSWTQGTVIRSWLLDLLVLALEDDPELAEIRGYVEDSGEGRWTVEEAINHAVPRPVITAALFARFASRQDDSPAMKAVAALRNQFGGHAVTKVATGEVESPA